MGHGVELSDQSADDLIEGFDQPERVQLGVRLKPDIVELDEWSDHDTVYVASQGAQEHDING